MIREMWIQWVMCTTCSVCCFILGYLAVSGMPRSSCLARTEKFVVRLTTLSAWLMGYTAAYCQHWETASSRKSRKGLSQQ